MDLFEALPVILPPNTCQLFPWDRIVRCLQLPAAPRGARIVRFSFPRLRVGQESCDNSFPRLRVGQESRRETFPPPGRDKNRAAKPSRRPGETRIAPRNLAAVRERQESRRETFPPNDLSQETVFLACRRVVWSKKRVFFLSRPLIASRGGEGGLSLCARTVIAKR